MNLMVPTITVDAIVAQAIEHGGKIIKAGEVIPLAYGLALQMRVLGLVGGFKDEDEKHLEATEALRIYGGDSWFPNRLQTIRNVSEYLASVGQQTNTNN